MLYKSAICIGALVFAMLWGCSGDIAGKENPGSEVTSGGDTGTQHLDGGTVDKEVHDTPSSGPETAPEEKAQPDTHVIKEQGPTETVPEPIAPEKAAPETSNPPGKGSIAIYLKGDLKPKTYQDKLQGQTPTNYAIAVSKYYIMRSINDPAPQLCFDHGKNAKIADMHKDNLVGSCVTNALKTGLYTYGKVKVEWVRYTVQGILHYNQKLPGAFTFFRAYSDTTYQGKSYKAGNGTIAFSLLPTNTIPYKFPNPPPIPGMKFQLVNGEFWMTFPYKRGLPVKKDNEKKHWARFHWEIDKAFRWEDLSTANFQKGSWDVTLNPSTAEPVKGFGVSGYYITSSID